MNKEKLGKRLGTLALTGIIASATLLPCTVNAAELIESDNTKMISSEAVIKKGKKQGKKMRAKEQTSGDTIKKEERKTKFKNLTDEEKETLTAKREAKKAENKAKYENLSDEEKEALKAEREVKKAERKAKYENLTDEEKEALKIERKSKRTEKSQDGSQENAKDKTKSEKVKQEITA